MFIFCFVSSAFGHIQQKYFYIEYLRLPMFSSRMIMVSQLTFKSFIPFEFTFVDGVSLWSTFICLHAPIQFSEHRLLMRLSLPHCTLLPPLSNSNSHTAHGFIPSLSVLLHWSTHSTQFLLKIPMASFTELEQTQSYLGTCQLLNLSNPVLITFWWENIFFSTQLLPRTLHTC